LFNSDQIMKNKNSNQKKILFSISNYVILFISFFFILSGFILMTGGGNENPSEFNPEIFNFQRIRLAPTLVLLGFLIAIFSILYNKNSKK